MKNRYKIKLNSYVIEKIKTIRKMKSEWGSKCSHFDLNCTSCAAWSAFEKTGNIPSVEDVVCLSNYKIHYRAGSD